MSGASTAVLLSELGVLRARGADARAFLQGQLSNDLTRLGADNTLLAGYHNPQGRVIALMRLAQLADDDLIAVLPRELMAPVAQRLTKFVLRSKVKLTDDSQAWQVYGILAGTDAPAALTGTAAPLARLGDALALRLSAAPARWLCVSPAEAPAPPGLPPGELRTWQRSAIAAGEPQVYAATSEEFVAQMLNLDVLGAIALDKGCYTGQEVIARAHYRGRVKRRLQRFVSETAAQLARAQAGALADGRSFKVVDAVQLPDGRCEFLAVAPFLNERPAGGAPSVPAESVLLAARQLPLPYALPA
jgi:tRNA-modifying protein YgfZ